MLYILPYIELKIINLGGGYFVQSWQVFQAIGRFLIIYFFIRETRRLNLKIKTTLAICFFSVFLVTFFEKILYFLSHKYLHLPSAQLQAVSLERWEFLGRVHFGGFIGLSLAILLGTIITKEYKNILKYLDIAFLVQIFGAFFYRMGNFFWNEHIGKITNVPWGVEFQGQVRHQVALYEMISLLLLFLIIWPLRKKISRPGVISLFVIGWMSLSRFITDFFRSTDLPHSNFHFSNGLTLNQVAYSIVFLVSFSLFLYLTLKYRENILNDTSCKTVKHENA